MAYRAANRRDRWKAMVAAIAVTGVIGAAILTGLNVKIMHEVAERLETFDITLPNIPPPPPPPPPPPRAEEQAGAPAAPKASPIVAPEPKVDVPTLNPVAAASEPKTGASLASGQGGAGTGTGAGGTGIGSGRGSGVGAVPARLVRNLTNADYRRLTQGRLARGSAALALRMDAGGHVDSCRVIRGSGDPVVDSGICGLVASRLLFSPARDSQGRPIPYSTNYMARWNRR